jgi:hypothetical protein
MWLIAHVTRIESIRWRDQRLKILDEESMFLFCGFRTHPHLSSHLCHIVVEVIWSCTLHPTKLMPDSLEPEPQSQLLVCHFCGGSLHPTTNLELLNHLKFSFFFLLVRNSVSKLGDKKSSRQGITKGWTTIFLFCQGTGLDQSWAVLES